MTLQKILMTLKSYEQVAELQSCRVKIEGKMACLLIWPHVHFWHMKLYRSCVCSHHYCSKKTVFACACMLCQMGLSLWSDTCVLALVINNYAVLYQ